MERVNQYFKNRIESFDDYYRCVKNECNLFHVHNWIQFFVSMYNDKRFENYFIKELNDRGDTSYVKSPFFYLILCYLDFYFLRRPKQF